MSRLPTNEEYVLFTKICKLKDNAVMKLMGKVLREYYSNSKVVATKDYVYAQGTIPIGLVAHADTVHFCLPQEIFFDRENNVIWSPEGLGADDRAGIYAIIDIIKAGYRPTVIICNEEEVGGKGAQKFVNDFPNPLGQVSFLLELDRMGYNDMVFYSCDNVEFEKYLEPYGFEADWGTFSDVEVIGPAWKVAFANLSIGYEDEHTKAERLYFDWMFSTIEKVKHILDDEKEKRHPFIYIEGHDYWSTYYGGCNSIVNKYGEIDYDYGYEKKHECCDFCGKDISIKDTVNIFDMGQWFRLCPTCANETTSICTKCGKRFFSQSDSDKICLTCRTRKDSDR